MKTKKKTRGPRFLLRQFPGIKEIIDSGQGIRVDVKPRDCSEGKKGQATQCALAKATRREYNADGVVIGLSFSYIVRGKKAIRFHTPPSVAREITSFDRHHDFAPGAYHLGPVSPSQRLGRRQERTRTKEHVESRIVHKGTARVRSIK